MKNKIDYLKLFEKFENDELSEKEKKNLLEDLKSNPKLRKEFELNSKIFETLKDDNLNEFKDLLDKVQKKLDSEE